jgi:hypothetical protein
MGKKGDEIVQKNYNAVDQALAHLHEVNYPQEANSKIKKPLVVSDKAPEFVQSVTAKIFAGKGDLLTVGAMPDDGTFLAAPRNGKSATWPCRRRYGIRMCVFNAGNVRLSARMPLSA